LHSKEWKKDRCGVDQYVVVNEMRMMMLRGIGESKGNTRRNKKKTRKKMPRNIKNTADEGRRETNKRGKKNKCVCVCALPFCRKVKILKKNEKETHTHTHNEKKD
jgi:hypothetical protein